MGTYMVLGGILLVGGLAFAFVATALVSNRKAVEESRDTPAWAMNTLLLLFFISVWLKSRK